MVTAQDGARRSLERDLHDGAQQELVALKVKLGLARTIASKEGIDGLGPRLVAAADVADQAVEALRDVARGIYPPLLEAEGLLAALTGQARKAPLPVTVLDLGITRRPREVESTAYFCALEALTNAVTHGHATAVQVTLDQPADGSLVVRVTDDGDGFDPAQTPPGPGITHMTDRADAANGHLDVSSRPGHGTTVVLSLPGVQTAPS